MTHLAIIYRQFSVTLVREYTAYTQSDSPYLAYYMTKYFMYVPTVP